ncbi:hypothetical protein G6O67_003424 [Ophiocordyceps sinensis]|uniref:Uncharacterized protein n=1 Tax=Ophiocordyceps sinensis TaxID=72228 RepID=A0A8H4PW79_9HYPO|nr:hypothetical protein G6O67_003424 [Ophiocordyceps sinensis]
MDGVLFNGLTCTCSALETLYSWLLFAPAKASTSHQTPSRLQLVTTCDARVRPGGVYRITITIFKRPSR